MNIINKCLRLFNIMSTQASGEEHYEKHIAESIMKKKAIFYLFEDNKEWNLSSGKPMPRAYTRYDSLKRGCVCRIVPKSIDALENMAVVEADIFRDFTDQSFRTSSMFVVRFCKDGMIKSVNAYKKEDKKMHSPEEELEKYYKYSTMMDSI